MELKRYTPNTITGAEELKLHLRRVAQQGYALDDEELDRDVRAVAAAIRDYSGRVVGAVVVTGPSFRIGVDRLEGEFIPLVQRGAREISAKLGYHLAEPQPPIDPAPEDVPPAAPSAQPRAASQRRKAVRTPRAA